MILHLTGTALFAALGFLLARQEGRDGMPAVTGLLLIAAGLWTMALRAYLKERS